MSKQYIDIDELKSAIALYKRINNVPLKDIVWITSSYSGIQEHIFDAEQIKEWEMIGFSNVDFAKVKFYLDEAAND